MADGRDLDLGAALSRLLALVVAREEPILEAHGLSMWEYVILGPLVGEEGLSQADLAERSGRDQTRLIAHLDALEGRGLVSRTVDPADRRRRLVRLTESGVGVVEQTRGAIRAMEDELLGPVAPGDRRVLRDAIAAVLAAGDGADAGR